MRLLAPALAAIRSTRAPARPWAANSAFAASRMRSRMPSGSRCHFRIRFALANAVARWLCRGSDLACIRQFENEPCSITVIASEAKQSIAQQRKNGLLRRFAPRNDGVDGPRRHRCARLEILIRPDREAAH